ncbi:MAG TPA: ATP synthase F1 subunit epsilon [Planctomycetota bacterium]|jgi:F-type H+-transporting ATPase subunit epsilon|nr:ATP synthase F1 subunit epsilon [Planctomycetota bacterium]
MARKFAVEIVTPERVVLSEEAESLVVPAEKGYLGILAGHAPLLCTLRPGEVRLKTDRGERLFATGGGFLEVARNKATLLVDSLEEASAIDVPRAEAALRRAREELAAARTETAREEARAAMERARNRLRVASRK